MAAHKKSSITDTFGSCLRRERIKAKLSIQDVAELCDVTSSSVGRWERDLVDPVQENYEKLLELFPALRNAPRPSCLAIPKPIGAQGMTFPGGSRSLAVSNVKDLAKQKINEKSDKLAVRSRTDIINNQSVTEAGSTYAEALLKHETLMGQINDVEAILRDLYAELDKAEDEVNSSNEQLYLIIEKEVSEKRIKTK